MTKEEYILNHFKFKQKPIAEVQVHCPFHSDDNPSAGINFNKRLFNCFKCGGLNFHQLYVKLNDLNKEKQEKNNTKRLYAKQRKLTKKVTKNLRSYGKDYLISRGLNLDNIPIEWEVCDDYGNKSLYGYLIFASIDGDIVARNLTKDDRPKYMNERGDKHLFWVDKEPLNKIVFLVEGIFDALSLYELGIRNICSTNGAKIGNKNADNVAFGFKDYTVLIIYDNDSIGYLGAKEVAANFQKFEVDHAIIEMPKSLGQDINEALVTDKDRTEIWLGKILDRFSPNDVHYTSKLFRSSSVRSLNILPTGIEELDDMLTGGFKDGGHIISGAPGTGKTAFIFNMAVNAVTYYNKRVMVNSCEISKRQSWARIATQHSKYTWEELEQEPRLLEESAYTEVQEISNNLVVVNGWPLSRITREADNFDIIVIDYIQRVREAYGGDESATRHRINSYVSTLTDLGALQGKICLMVSSLGRAAYNKPDEYGLKESGSIEYMGATVSRISPIGDPMNGKFIWRVQKNTRGEIGIIRLSNVDLGHCNFSNVTAEKVST